MGTFVNEFVHGLQNGSSGTLLPIQAVGLNYQKCTTAAETAEKAVSALTGFKLLEGATVVVAFTNSNTANNPTLKVGTTGAKAIYYRGTAIPAGYLAAGRVYQFTYDGNYWQFLGDINTDSSVQQNAATTTNLNYPILLGYDSSTTAVTGSVNKTSNLLYNPSTQLLSTPKLTVNNTTTLNGSTTADSITAGDLLVNGGANFVNIPTAPTAADGTNNNQLATTEFVYNAFRVNDALVFKGIVNSNSDLPATHKQGWVYKVGTSGTYAGETCEIGDTIYCITDGTTATNAHWAIIQNNIDTFPWSRLSGVPSTFNPSAHAVTNSATYGAATTSLYGHVKLVSGNLNGQTYTDGLAAASSHTHSQYLTSHQTMYYRPIKLNSTEVLSSTSSTALTISGGAGLTLTSTSGGIITFALASHAVDATTYGVGTSALYGHVKLATGDISSQTYTAGIAAAAAHNHGTIPLVSGGTGISEVTGETWYTSYILHPHFEVFMDDGFLCMYRGPLDGITSITDFLTSPYFKMAARVTVPVYANGILLFTGTIMTNAINNNPLYTYILFPDAVPYSGMIVNGVHGTLTYSDDDGVYLTNVWPNQPYYVTAGLSSMLGDDAIGDTGTPVYYNGSSLAIVSKVNSASVADTATSASYATTASSASFATSATIATSASYATNAGSASGLSATIANNRLPTRLQASSSTSVTAAGATEQGWHYIGGNDANKPLFKQVDGLTGNDFRIMTTAYGSTWLQQIATDFRSNDIFTRRNQNGTWQPWTALVKMPQGATAADLCPANNNCIAIFDNSRNATIKATSATLSVDGNLSTPGTITASGGFIGTATSASYATTAGTANSVAWNNIASKPDTYTPSAHATTSSATYGGGTTSNYGHVKLISGALALDRTYVDGEAAAAAHTHTGYLTSHQTMYYRPIKMNNTDVLTNTSSTALTLSAGTGITLTSTSAGIVTITNNSTNTDASVLQNAAITTNKQYPILLGYDDRTTVYTGAVNKAAGFTYNPSTQILTVPKLSVSTITLLNGSTTIDDATIGDLIVNGSVQLNSLAQGQTPASTSNDTTLATTAFVKTATAAITSVAQATSANYATTAGAFSSVASVSLTGDVSGSASSVKGWAITTTIGDSKVTSAKIADNAVVTAKINNGAVTSAKLGDSSVVTAKINDSAVTSAKLANSGVTANTYGNTSQQTPTSGNTFNIPYFTVSAKGIVTSAGVTTVKLPNSIASATTATSASYATNAGSAASATVATSANSVAWANVSGHAAGVKSDLGIESSGSTYLKKDGTWDTPTDTNDAVTQTATTTDASYEVLFSGTADNITRTEGAGKNSNLTFNPSTHVLTVTGNLYLKNPGGTSDWTNPEKLVLVGASNKEFSFKVNNSGNNVDVGWDWDTGAGSGLGLRGSGYTSPGQFFLYARNSTTGYAGLAGDANGVLKWNNRRVVTATDATQIGSASQPVYINSAGYATACSYLLSTNIVYQIHNATTGFWSAAYGMYNAAPVISVTRHNATVPTYIPEPYANTLVYGGIDTKGMLSIGYNSPIITFGGASIGNSTADDPKWWIKLTGTTGTTYNLNNAGKTGSSDNAAEMYIIGATSQANAVTTYSKSAVKMTSANCIIAASFKATDGTNGCEMIYDANSQSIKFVFS